MTRAVTRKDFPDTLGAWQRSVEERLEKLFTKSASSRPAEVSSDGTFTVRGLLDLLGSVSLKDDTGVELVRLGSMPIGRGLEFKRGDGSQALAFRKPFADTDPLSLVLLDRASQVVFGENALGNGLGRPLLELPMQPIAAASGTAVTCGPFGWERTTTSTSFVSLFAYDGKAQNGFVDLKVAAKCSDGTTSGEIQVVDASTGLALGGFLAPPWTGVIPLGTTTLTVFDPAATQVMSLVHIVGFAESMRIEVQVRRTAGAGTITVAIPQSVGG
jgi:hypothetical protein